MKVQLITNTIKGFHVTMESTNKWYKGN